MWSSWVNCFGPEWNSFEAEPYQGSDIDE